MPQAMEWSFATPMIRPRLFFIRSVIVFLPLAFPLSLQGEGRGEGPQSLLNPHDHPLLYSPERHCSRISKPHILLLQESASGFHHAGFAMLPAIQLDNQIDIATGKIRIVWRNRILPAKF